MTTEKLYSADDVCKELNITHWTLSNWYRWETKQLNEGIITKKYLPEPIRPEHTKGSPRRWNNKMLNELKYFKSKIVSGRNGVYGAYSNPSHTSTKKYIKSLNND